MLMKSQSKRIARTVVALIFAGFIQVGFTAPAAHAAAPIKPTISSITADAGTMTVNMVTTGIDATSWRWIVTRRQVAGCDNSYNDTWVNSTSSLVSSFQILGVTAGCIYSVKVAGYNGVIGEYAESEKLVGGYTNGLNYYTKSESGASTGMTHVPFTTGTCSVALATVANIDTSYGTGGPTGCPSDGFTTYYVGYIKAPYTGSVTFRSRSDDGFVLNIQGQNVLMDMNDHGSAVDSNTAGSINMVAGEIYRIEAWYHENLNSSDVHLDWLYGSQGQIPVPNSALATDPSVLGVGCPIGTAARCAAGSAYEIKQATGTNMDGLYWIMVNGTPTLTYCIMNSAMSGGGWMLAMKGKQTTSTFSYTSSYWTNTTQLNDSYPERWKSGDTQRDIDAKYGVFSYNKSNQIMALFPEQSTYAGGAIAAGTTGNTSRPYGFSWIETTTAMLPWTAYNASASGSYPAGWGGTSYNVAFTNGPTATPACVNSATTLSNLFNTASRCAFRQVGYTYSSGETPYSAIGQNLFYSQNKIRFFGLNYGSANTTNRDRVRFGFGWNENGDGDESSNDGTAGIGIDNNTWGTNLTAGSGQRCCAQAGLATPLGQNGISGGDNTYRNIPFEMYIRNSAAATVAGRNLRATYKRTSSLTAGAGFSTSGTNGSNTFRISPLREGFYIDSSTGVITLSESVGIGTYTETVTVTDTDGISAIKAVTIQVVADSSETDTAISFDGSQSLASAGTIGLWGDQTWEAWVKPTNTCSGASNMTALGSSSFVIFCNSSDWWISFKDSGGTWNGYKTSQRVIQNEWMHLAVVRSGSTITAYANNRQLNFYSGSSAISSYTQSVYNVYNSVWVGGTGANGQFFTGVVDEVKIWSEARTLTQIWSGAHTAENISSSGLLMYWDFNEGSGSALSRGQRADDNFNLTPASPSQWVPVATTTTSGPYTVVSVPRTLINKIGGWRAPDSVTAITALVLGGGGGGGGGYQGGGGGAGGFIETTVAIDPLSVYAIKVGVGGRGASNPSFPMRGETSTAFGFSAVGGGSGESEFIIATVNTQQAATSGGSGGGGAHGNSRVGGSGIAGQGNAGAYGTDLAPTCSQLDGGGGGGAGGTGYSAVCTDGGLGTHGGWGGLSKLSVVIGDYVAGGGGGSARYANTGSMRGLGGSGLGSVAGSSGYIGGALVGATGGAQNGAPNTGTGGGAGLSTDGATGYGGDGGSGTVTFRWITAFKPSYTKPTIAYLNAGMTETFTVNVANDSQTAGLTRTFRWESSTTSDTGTYSLIKQGTGAANAFFAWVPSDTSTSGNKYTYRVIVTDSDTAGLFIVDTSTAVYAVINGKLVLTGNKTPKKTINVARSDTYTITDGTPTFVTTLSPTITGITIDTSTSRSVVLKINETVTVGTYLETITVTDSVTGSYSFPLTITIAAPPTLVHTNQPIDNGLVFEVDPANSASYSLATGTLSDVSGANHAITSVNGFTYSKNYMGTVALANGTNQYLTASGFTLLTNWTIETYIKVDSLGNENCILCTKSTNGNIPYYLALSGSGTIAAGFRNSAGAHFRETDYAVTTGQWVHVTATFDGTLVHIWINGVEGTYFLNQAVNGTLPESAGDGTVIINNGPTQPSTVPGGFTIGYIRLYNYGFSASKDLINYNATRDRFLNANINRLRVSQKYGSTTSETFTATGGIDTKTVTFTPVGFTGIALDTSTTGVVVFKLLSNAQAGSYYDTVTVTDDVGASTQVVFTIMISKADTVTVYIDTPTAMTYTGAPAAFTPTVRASGLVSTDTGTAVSSILYQPSGLTCATGGSCNIGDIGPGGGVVFITPSTAGGNGKYFEAAPANWAGIDDIQSVAKFCTASTNQDGISRGANNSAIGGGALNTATFEQYCTGGAIKLVADYAGGGFTDWFMPSDGENAELANVRVQAGLLELKSAWPTGTYGYWSSNELSASVVGSLVAVNSAWSIGGTNKNDSVHNMVRPVRQFTPCFAVDSCTALASTTKPSQAGGYLITPSGFIFSSGILSNYETVTYISTPLVINRAAQSAQQIPYYSPTYPETMTVYTGGGSGTGAQIFTVLSGGTANSCAFDYRKLSTAGAGTCNIQVVKLGDRNYLTDTATAYIYIMQFIVNQPAPAVGSGSTIALSGATAITRDPNAAPTISSVYFVPMTCVLSNCTEDHWEIAGAGFGATGNTDTVVKFWRNKVVVWELIQFTTNYVVSDTLIRIRNLPAGAATGKILVITANGIAVSPDNWVAP